MPWGLDATDGRPLLRWALEESRFQADLAPFISGAHTGSLLAKFSACRLGSSSLDGGLSGVSVPFWSSSASNRRSSSKPRRLQARGNASRSPRAFGEVAADWDVSVVLAPFQCRRPPLSLPKTSAARRSRPRRTAQKALTDMRAASASGVGPSGAHSPVFTLLDPSPLWIGRRRFPSLAPIVGHATVSWYTNPNGATSQIFASEVSARDGLGLGADKGGLQAGRSGTVELEPEQRHQLSRQQARQPCVRDHGEKLCRRRRLRSIRDLRKWPIEQLLD